MGEGCEFSPRRGRRRLGCADKRSPARGRDGPRRGTAALSLDEGARAAGAARLLGCGVRRLLLEREKKGSGLFPREGRRAVRAPSIRFPAPFLLGPCSDCQPLLARVTRAPRAGGGGGRPGRARVGRRGPRPSVRPSRAGAWGSRRGGSGGRGGGSSSLPAPRAPGSGATSGRSERPVGWPLGPPPVRADGSEPWDRSGGSLPQ